MNDLSDYVFAFFMFVISICMLAFTYAGCVSILSQSEIQKENNAINVSEFRIKENGL